MSLRSNLRPFTCPKECNPNLFGAYRRLHGVLGWHKLKIVFFRGYPHFWALFGHSDILVEITARFWSSNTTEHTPSGVISEIMWSRPCSRGADWARTGRGNLTRKPLPLKGSPTCATLAPHANLKSRGKVRFPHPFHVQKGVETDLFGRSPGTGGGIADPQPARTRRGILIAAPPLRIHPGGPDSRPP